MSNQAEKQTNPFEQHVEGAKAICGEPFSRACGEPLQAAKIFEELLIRQSLFEFQNRRLLRAQSELAHLSKQLRRLALSISEAEELSPDVVLMDVTMPEMDGIEATARIAKKHPTIRIIGLSMHDDNETRERILSAGASDCKCKSSSLEELVAAIRRVMAK